MRKHLALLLLAAPLGGCLSYPPPPEAPYHAVGQDSRWDLIIDDKNITFIAEGKAPLTQPVPQAIIGIAGEIYQTPRINVNVVHGQCATGGRTYHDSVQLTVDGSQHRGCGGDMAYPAQPPAGTALAGTNWRVASINGRPTPAAGNYSMSFETQRLGARFGCNSIGGGFSQSGDRMTAQDLISTQMACAEPVMTFEREGLAVLAQPVTLSWEGSRLTLSSAAGSIKLVPAG